MLVLAVLGDAPGRRQRWSWWPRQRWSSPQQWSWWSPRQRSWWSVVVGVLLGRRRDARDVELIVDQHRTEVHLTGDLDELFGLLLVLHARQVDDDGVALAQDLRLGHAEAVDTLADALHGQIEARCVEVADRLLGDRDAALQVEAERRRVAGDKRARAAPRRPGPGCRRANRPAVSCALLRRLVGRRTVGRLDLACRGPNHRHSARRSRPATCRPCAAAPDGRCGSGRCRRSPARRCRHRAASRSRTRPTWS